jgi:hypothetical protein
MGRVAFFMTKTAKKSNQCTAKAHVGRPSKYDPKFCDELIEYFDIEPHFETPVLTRRKDGTEVEKVAFIASDLPTLAGFAVKIGVDRDTLKEWAHVHPEFSAAIKKAKECQENILVTNGLKGLYDTSFAIFTAKNVMGWRDKQEITGKDGKDLVITWNDNSSKN